MKQVNEHPLRRERLRRGWDQKQLADFAEVSLNSVVRAEQGKPLRVDICRRLCDCFGKEKPEDLGLRCVGLADVPYTSPGPHQQEQPPPHHVPALLAHMPDTQQLSPSTDMPVPFVSPQEGEIVLSRGQLLLFEEQQAADMQASLLYDDLETAIIKVVIVWSRQSEAVYLLQASVRATMKEFDAMAQPLLTDEMRMSRRYALRAIARLPIQVYGLSALHLERVLFASAGEILPLYATGMVALHTLAQENDLTPVERILADYLPTLETLAQQSSPHQATAAHLTGQGYLLKVLRADSGGRLDLMEAYSKAARYYGHIAQDPNIEASALTKLAVKYAYEGREVKALQTYQEAVALPGFSRVSALLQGRIYAGLAGKHAYCQQEKEALYFLGVAKDIFPANPEDDPYFHFNYSSKYSLALWEGLVYEHIGQHAASWNTLTTPAQFQPVPGLHERNRAEFLNEAASVALLQRELATSVTYLKAAEDLAWTIKHEQRYREVSETYRLMKGLYPREQATKDMREIINSRQLVTNSPLE